MMTGPEFTELYGPLYRRWARLRAIIVVIEDHDGLALAADGELGFAEGRFCGAHLSDWCLAEAGIDIPDAPGLWLLDCEVLLDPGCDTPSGPAELSAAHRGARWRRPYQNELFAVSRGMAPAGWAWPDPQRARRRASEEG